MGGVRTDNWRLRIERVYPVDGGGNEIDSFPWENGEVQFRFLNGNISMLVLTQLDMVDLWGSNVIRSGDGQQSMRLAEATGDFDLTYTMRYTVQWELL